MLARCLEITLFIGQISQVEVRQRISGIGLHRTLDSGLPRTAYEYLERALNHDPTAANIARDGAHLLDWMHLPEFATTWYERLLALAPDDATARAALARTLRACHRRTEATRVGVYKDWNAFTGSDSSGKVCFIASQPTDSQYSQTVSGRDPAFFQITSAPANGVRNEASTIVGFRCNRSSR